MSDSSNGVKDRSDPRSSRAPRPKGAFSQESRFSRGASQRNYGAPPKVSRPYEDRRVQRSYRAATRDVPEELELPKGSAGGKGRPPAASSGRMRPPASKSSSTANYLASSRYAGVENYTRRSSQSSATHRGRQGSAPVQRNPRHGNSQERPPRRRSTQSNEAIHHTGPQLAKPIITNRAEGYQTRAPHQGPIRKRSKAPKIVAAVAVIAVAVVAVAWLWTSGAFASEVSITVNGSELVVKPGTTITQLVNDGYVSPKAGNLMAIDGSLLKEGGGEPFSATVAQEAVPADYVVKADDAVVIGDGGDTVEETTTEQVEVPFEVASQDTEFGALHRYVEGQNGVAERVTGTVSGIVQENVIQPPVSGGYVQYNADPGEDKVVALTFDDGPWDTTTQQILDILAENDAKATFFTIGNQIADHADLVKAASDAGHQICTHSWDHASGSGEGVNLTYMSPEEQVQEIQQGYDAIASATGKDASTVIRSPGGNFYGEIINTLEPYISAEINWNIDTEDWKRPGADAIVAAIESAQPGDVILMHDGGGDRSQTVEALGRALPTLREQGYRFITIDELLAYPMPTSQASEGEE